MTVMDWANDASDYEDDASTNVSEDGGVYLVASPTSSKTSVEAAVKVKHYPVMYNHHRSTYDRVLYDIDGNVLRDENGDLLNVYTVAFREALQRKTVRCIHVCMQRPGYRYFITSQSQQDRFMHERDKGFALSSAPVEYHVYDDEPGVVILPTTVRLRRYHRSALKVW